MADIGVALRARLLANSTVAGLVSTRIYPRRLAQGAPMPAVVYHKVGGADEGTLAGLAGLNHQRLQIDCYAATKIGADALSNAVRAAIAASGGRGVWGSVFVNGCTPQGGPRDDDQSRGDGTDEVYHITIRDYLVSYSE